jgi:NAD(P)-dependent dehydrogenase (short-subunit alcohol dehydrogenase family)
METTWTLADLPDQSGRTALVTGASSGLGLATAEALARAGADVVLAVRDRTRGDAAADRIARHGRRPRVHLVDLSDLDQVRAFPDTLGDLRIDLLVNNAGIMAVPHALSPQGVELQLATNHLGHFALTGLLLPRLTPEARVVTVSSDLHRAARTDFDDPASRRRYGRWRAYGRSKLANLLFAYELDRRLRTEGSGIRSLAAHPGHAESGLRDHMDGRVSRLLVRGLDRLVGRSTQTGALPILRAATDPAAQGGQYFGPAGRGRSAAPAVLNRPTEAALDPELAARVWRLSEELSWPWPQHVAR